MQILTIEELSVKIHKAKASIYSDLIRNPSSLPPHFKLPKSRRILFRSADVDSWIESLIVKHAEPKKRGRPTKLAQIQNRAKSEAAQKAEASHV